MPGKKYLAIISILVKDRQTYSAEVQNILSKNGHLILARLGVNPERSCIEKCSGLMAVAVAGTRQEINNLVKRLDSLYGIVAKVNIMTK